MYYFVLEIRVILYGGRETEGIDWHRAKIPVDWHLEKES